MPFAQVEIKPSKVSANEVTSCTGQKLMGFLLPIWVIPEAQDSNKAET